MSSYFNVNNNASSIMNSIFSSLGNNSSSKQASMLGDYYAIQNGSYYKMAKKFYANKAAGTSQTSKTDTSSLTQKLEALNTNQVNGVSNKYKTSGKKVNTETMKATGEALSTLGNLMNNRLYDKSMTAAFDGGMIEDYNKDAILTNIRGFVKEYNKVIDNVGESSNKQTLESGVRMINQTKIYSNSLQAIGITVGDDNQLTFDEDTFAKADMKDVKALFAGTVSYGKNIQNRMMELYSAESMSQTAVSGLYNSNAVSQLSVGSLFDSMY